MEHIRQMLCAELQTYSTKSGISQADLQTIHMLTDTIKNIDKIYKLAGSDSEVYEEKMSDEDKDILKKAVEILNR